MPLKTEYFRHELDIDGYDSQKGEKAEELFKGLFEQKYGANNIKPSTVAENKKHIDFWCMGNDNRWHSVDVKSAKFNTKNEWVGWIEFVNNGYLGWVYGKQEYMAFENPQKDGFICVSIKKIRRFCEENLKPSFTTSKSNAYHNYYIRKKEDNSFDCVMVLGWNEINGLKEWEL